GIPGYRQLVITSAGNLATTQAVIARIRKDIKDGAAISLENVCTIYDAADYIGQLSVAIQEKYAQHNNSVNFEASFLLGGQIGIDPPAVMLIYPQGNYIATCDQTPYFQIGENKYGKPVLDRILRTDTELDTASLSALVSMDSTMRSNLTVGPPIELMSYATDSGVMNHSVFAADDEYLRDLTRSWDQQIVQAFAHLPTPPNNQSTN